MTQLTIEFIVEPDGAEFHSHCPALKGLHVDGSTRDEALRNAFEAAVLYIESMSKHNELLPECQSAPRPPQRERG